MEFPGPVAADLADVHSLNRAYLRLLTSTRDGSELRDRLPAQVRDAIRGVSAVQQERLAEVPFLLLSLREQDGDLWERLLSRPAGRDLFSRETPLIQPRQKLLFAALAYVWQLGRHNVYAARLVCGASRRWCELVSGCPLARFLDRAGERGDLLVPRFAHDAVVWQRLLTAGVADEPGVRTAAHLTALQTLLTRSAESKKQPLRSAACARKAPSSTRN